MKELLVLINRVIDKLMSGRYILTIIGGVAFFWCVIHKQLESATTTAILLAIFSSYFDRKDRMPPKGGT